MYNVNYIYMHTEPKTRRKLWHNIRQTKTCILLLDTEYPHSCPKQQPKSPSTQPLSLSLSLSLSPTLLRFYTLQVYMMNYVYALWSHWMKDGERLRDVYALKQTHGDGGKECNNMIFIYRNGFKFQTAKHNPSLHLYTPVFSTVTNPIHITCARSTHDESRWNTTKKTHTQSPQYPDTHIYRNCLCSAWLVSNKFRVIHNAQDVV